MIEKMLELRAVNDFMRTMGQVMPEKPIIPPVAIQELRSNLILEENKELAEAAKAGDMVEVADALGDLTVVTLGAWTAFGFSPELATEIFAEVHRSNMSKACNNPQEASDSIQALVLKNAGTKTEDYYANEVGNYWVVGRVSDGKVLKGINFSEPDIKGILERHGIL